MKRLLSVIAIVLSLMIFTTACTFEIGGDSLDSQNSKSIISQLESTSSVSKSEKSTSSSSSEDKSLSSQFSWTEDTSSEISQSSNESTVENPSTSSSVSSSTIAPSSSTKPNSSTKPSSSSNSSSSVSASTNSSNSSTKPSSSSLVTTTDTFVNFGRDVTGYGDQDLLTSAYTIGLYTLNSGCKFTANTGAKTLDGETFTLACQLGKSGSSSSKSLKFTVSGPSTLVVYAIVASSGVSSASLFVNKGSTKASTLTITDNFAKYSVNISSSGEYYLSASSSASINVYGIALLDGTNSAPQTSSTSSNSSVSNSTSNSRPSASSNSTVSSTTSSASSSSTNSSTSSSTSFTPTVIVDGGFSGTNGTTVGGIKTYKTVASALSYLQGANISGDKIVQIKAGTYKEKLSIPASLTNLKFIGDKNAETKITYGDCSSTAGGTDASATVTVLANGFSASYIHFENSYDYLNGSETDKQALAMLTKADKIAFYDCEFSGHQDTLETVNGRQYFKNCKISGSVDFIFGNNPSVLFENCEIYCRYRGSNGGYITAMKGNDGTNGSKVAKYGLVFKNCSLTCESKVASGSVSLGRPWRADATVAWINCSMGGHISTKAYSGANSKQRYVYMNGGGLKNEPQNAYFVEYGNTGAGSISSAVKGCSMLTASQAETYTIANIFATTNGGVTYSSSWDASSEMSKLMSY